jgi:predicted GNAT family acetyltransferase
MDAEVQHRGDDQRGMFYMEHDGREIAAMSYIFAGTSKIIIEYTEVHPSFGGQGIGQKLVQAGVEWARKKGYKIIPLCPFAKKMFEKTPAYKDVLDQ